MSCSVVNASAFFPPPPPPSDEGPGWLALGVILALLSVSLLTLGTNVQRYGLSVVMARGSCCGARGPVGCMSCSTAVWAGGWLIYVCGNGVYTFAVTLAPATLCSALLGTAVVWNAGISRLLLGERLSVCDYHGGVLIMGGIALSQVFGPTDSIEHTAPQFAELFQSAAGLVYLGLMVSVRTAFERASRAADADEARRAG